MNIVILCFLGNHVSNALQIPDEMLVVSNKLEDTIHNSHKYYVNVSSNTNQNLLRLLDFFMNKKHSSTETNEINLILFLMDYIFSIVFKTSLRRQDEGFHNNCKSSCEFEKIINTIAKKLQVKAFSQDKRTKTKLVANRYKVMRYIQNSNNLNIVKNIFHEKNTKATKLYTKINREEEGRFENPSDLNNIGLLNYIVNISENKSQEPTGEAVVNNDERKIKASSEISENSFEVRLNFESSEGTQEVDVIKAQDSIKVSNNKTIFNKPKIENNSKSYKKIQRISSSSKEKSKHKKISSFNSKLLMLISSNPYQYHYPSIILRSLMPRTIVKRSSPSATTRQFDMPGEGNFPFSTAGSSLYGSYAYAHTRPSGFGTFSPFGGEGGEFGEPIEGGEIVQPIGGGEEGAEE